MMLSMCKCVLCIRWLIVKKGRLCVRKWETEFTLHLAIQYLCMKGRDTHSPDPESPLEEKKIITDGYNFRGKMSQRDRERI